MKPDNVVTMVLLEHTPADELTMAVAPLKASLGPELQRLMRQNCSCHLAPGFLLGVL